MTYTPADVAELDADLSGDALQTLLRIRRVADRDETDGWIGVRNIEALRVLHGVSRKLWKKSIQQLVSCGRILEASDGFVDVHFAEVCRVRAKRVAEREQWKKAKRSHKGPLSGGDSIQESGKESAESQPAHVTSSSYQRQGIPAASAANGRATAIPRGIGEPPDEPRRDS